MSNHTEYQTPVWAPVMRWLKSTPRRTFVLYPLCVIAFEAAFQGGRPAIVPWGLPLLIWGYLQYRLVGGYRVQHGKGGPGIEIPPERVVDEGLYRFVRNPMYLGHLIFMLGLAITFRSWLAVAILAANAVWFHRRVLEDEVRLEARFGDAYIDYKARVKRWIPGLF